MVQLKASLNAGCSHCAPYESVQQICHYAAGSGWDVLQNGFLLLHQLSLSSNEWVVLSETLRAVVFTREEQTGTSTSTDDLMTRWARRGHEEKRGSENTGSSKNKHRKDGQEAGMWACRTQKSCGGWSLFFLKYSPLFNNLHLSFQTKYLGFFPIFCYKHDSN